MGGGQRAKGQPLTESAEQHRPHYGDLEGCTGSGVGDRHHASQNQRKGDDPQGRVADFPRQT
ncbi:hypothetical protein CVS28_13630 [Arthrobacter glacialis]|uniref:Uncharacterized protein n=1 Tax=Arthrobacter glacialis TaxID=1664 RepID=A0A2S3ZTL5_ARTGL|nr:hypothetical protein CVS28_13630 [Arthrobacter glacialis]POH72611.1 hypothetical protein CVS27_14640 [Arthrobacter glacialis]